MHYCASFDSQLCCSTCVQSESICSLRRVMCCNSIERNEFDDVISFSYNGVSSCE